MRQNLVEYLISQNKVFQTVPQFKEDLEHDGVLGETQESLTYNIPNV